MRRARRTFWKCAVSAASTRASPAAVASAASGTSEAMTATSRSVWCGNRWRSSASRCFQGRLGANSVSVSVVTPRRAAETATASTASITPNATTSRARPATAITTRPSTRPDPPYTDRGAA